MVNISASTHPVIVTQVDSFNPCSLPVGFWFHCRMQPSQMVAPSVSLCRHPLDLWSISTDLRMRKMCLPRRTYSSQSIILRVMWQPLRHLLHTGFWPRYGKKHCFIIRICLLNITLLHICFPDNPSPSSWHQTTRSEFDSSEFEVHRRYQDFFWLKGKLEEAHPTLILHVGVLK